MLTHRTLRATALAATALALATYSPAARADGDPAACWYRDLERLDHVVNTPTMGDNRFFTGTAKQASIAVMLMNRASMKDFPLSMYELRQFGTGCSNTYLNSARYALEGIVPASAGTYVPSRTYLRPEYTYAPGNQNAFSSLFLSGRFYRFQDGWTATAGTAYGTSTLACAQYTGGEELRCASCMASNGYFIDDRIVSPAVSGPMAAVFSGNWLNFYPPKHVLLRLALKRFSNGPEMARLRLTALGNRAGDGAYVEQAWQPSCNGNGSAVQPLTNGVDGLTFTPTAMPLAEALFNAGQYYSSRNRYFGGTKSFFTDSTVMRAKSGSNDWNEGTSASVASMCANCNQHFLLVFADGRGDEGNPACTLGTLTPGCTATAQCSTTGMGTEGDGQWVPTAFASRNTTDYPTHPLSGPLTAPGTCAADFADDVARFLYKADLNNKAEFGAFQNVITYVIGVGSNLNNRQAILRAVADQGGGQFFSATDYGTLERSLSEAVNDIIRRATSFSVATISTVQTRGTTYAFIPRFRPDQGTRWEGHLYRYKLFNEFAAGCTDADTRPTPADRRTGWQSRNPNGDTDCGDVYLQDANDKFIGEDDDGNFLVLDTSAAYNPANNPPWPATTTPATPVWDAAERITAGGSRRIYTVVDLDDDGMLEPHEQLDFDLSRPADFAIHLGIMGPTDAFCNELGIDLRMADLDTGTDVRYFDTAADCALVLMKWVHGQDLFDEDGDLDVTELRSQKILGDIFHSSPILVTAPIPRFLCDLGLNNQCADSLYSTATPDGQDAYDKYQDINKEREQVVVVGANDGMIHGFRAGVYDSTTKDWDLGTGDEAWAFIPPDVLPKLKRLMVGLRHEIFVDGTPMVREVWADSSTNPGRKDADEFHTIMVIGERTGGRSVTALDLSDPDDPVFRWVWPPPGSTEALAAGESWADFSPNAPPIVPVAVADDDGPLEIAGVKASEKWGVFLSGGADPLMIRGRSVTLIDVWTGEPMWRFAAQDASSSSDLRSKLWPVAATVAAIDIGEDEEADARPDGIFDNAVVGDLGGQLWVFRMTEPGADKDGDGWFDNWYGARAFTPFKDDASASFRKRSPFYQMPAVTLVPGSLVTRVYIGSGDRRNIRDAGGGECSTQNLSACARRGCAYDVRHDNYFVDDQEYTAVRTITTSGTQPSVNTDDYDTAANTLTCTGVSKISVSATLTCGSTTVSDTFGMTCDWSGSPVDGCSGIDQITETPLSIASTTALEPSRYYSIRLYGNGDPTATNQRLVFNSETDAVKFDDGRWSDTDLANAEPGGTLTPAFASSSSPGWYVPYVTRPDEHTASGSNILAGCVVWSTLQPSVSAPVDPATCLPPQANTSRTYQAHFITGAKECGTASLATVASRFTSQTSIVPPPPSTPVVSINRETGEIRRGLIRVEPGAPPTQLTVGESDPLGMIYWLEIPRTLDNCRHKTGSESSCQ